MKKLVYIDMDDVLCNFNKALLENFSICKQYPQAEYGFFANLEPIEGGVESVKKLIDSDIYDPYILTAPSVRNPFSYTEKRVWIEKHFGLEFVNKLIISPNKGLLKGDYLIDDNVAGKGQENFEGEVLRFGGYDFPDWVSVMNYLHGIENLKRDHIIYVDLVEIEVEVN
jgi:5'(3')-deoxyribonucleotidase